MKKLFLVPTLSTLCLLAAHASPIPARANETQLGKPDITLISPTLYPPLEKLVVSSGNTTYFVDPAKGNDTQAGTQSNTAWQSIAKINTLKLAPGDKVVIAPGRHTETLKPSGEGSAEKPIVIEFLPGLHTFTEDNAFRLPMFVSNSCDAPKTPKPIGILVQNIKHMRLQGGGVSGPKKTEILYAGRMVEIFNDHSEDITYSGLVFDLKRPTVSEFRVIENTANTVLIQVAEGSTYEIKDGKFSWTGDIGTGPMMVQQAIPENGSCVRMGFDWNPLRAAEKVENNAAKATE